MSTDVTPEVTTAAPDDEAESAASVWITVGLFVGFIVVASSCFLFTAF